MLHTTLFISESGTQSCARELLVLKIWEKLQIITQTDRVGIYLFKGNHRNTRTRCEICSKLTIKTAEWRHSRHSGVFIVNFQHISHFNLVFLLLTLNM